MNEAEALEQILLTRAQVARLIGVSVGTVIRLQREGLLKPVRLTSKPTSMVHFKRKDVLAFVEQASKSH